MVQKVESQMKELFLKLNDPILIMGFLAKFLFVFDTKSIHEIAAKRLLLYVENIFSNALNIWMCAKERLSPFVVYVRKI